MISLLRRVCVDFLHLLAPRLCPGCDELLSETERGYCACCHISLEAAPFPFEMYDELTRQIPRMELVLDAVGARYTFVQRSPAQRLVHALKYQGCYALGIELGIETGKAMRMFREFDDTDLIVPVPLHRARRRQRGYNQAEAIAEGLARSFNRRMEPRVLTRTRHTRSQTTLSAGDRRTNVASAFRVAKGGVEHRSVLLCDDVLTTGATLNACAAVLIGAGARRVAAVTVARDMLR